MDGGIMQLYDDKLKELSKKENIFWVEITDEILKECDVDTLAKRYPN